MKFGRVYAVQMFPVMKKILFLLAMAVIISSCSSSKEVTANGENTKKEKKLAQQAKLKEAVESRRYIIKVNRIYTHGGGQLYLVPEFNYIIVEGEIASVSLGYVGRSFASRRITGINFNGHTVKYEMVNNQTKGMYDVTMKVAKGNDTFDFYIRIEPSGYCSVSLNNLFLQTIDYRGEVVPVITAKGLPDDKTSVKF
jgi:hypothetical protein